MLNEVKTCSNGVEKCHVKILNGPKSYIGQIFKQNHEFFIVQDCITQRKALFYLMVLLGNNFPQFDKIAGKNTNKTSQADTKVFRK